MARPKYDVSSIFNAFLVWLMTSLADGKLSARELVELGLLVAEKLNIPTDIDITTLIPFLDGQAEASTHENVEASARQEEPPPAKPEHRPPPPGQS